MQSCCKYLALTPPCRQIVGSVIQLCFHLLWLLYYTVNNLPQTSAWFQPPSPYLLPLPSSLTVQLSASALWTPLCKPSWPTSQKFPATCLSRPSTSPNSRPAFYPRPAPFPALITGHSINKPSLNFLPLCWALFSPEACLNTLSHHAQYSWLHYLKDAGQDLHPWGNDILGKLFGRPTSCYIWRKTNHRRNIIPTVKHGA